MEEQDKQRQILSLFSEISIRMSSILDMDQLITFFVGNIAEVLRVGRASLMLLDQTKKELYIKATHGVDAADNTSMKLGQIFGSWVVQNGKPLLVKDVATEFPDLLDEQSSQYHAKSFIIVPIKVKDTVMGILSLSERKDNEGFSRFDLDVANLLCNFLGVHIENLKLFENNTNLVIFDNLTGLFNHRHFQEQLLDEIYRAERYEYPLSLLMLDIDNFAGYNQTCGYSSGDSVLKQIGKIIRDNIRRADSATRYGPEEFMIILPHTPLKQAIFVGEKIKEAIGYSVFAEEKIPGSTITRITVSVGAAEYKAGLGREELIKHVKSAISEAKQKGKNCVCAFK